VAIVDRADLHDCAKGIRFPDAFAMSGHAAKHGANSAETWGGVGSGASKKWLEAVASSGSIQSKSKPGRSGGG
jgi:hypothetical protein